MLLQPKRDRRTDWWTSPENVYWAVRRNDGQWLARPAPAANVAMSNMDPWTRTLPDIWPFDSEREAHKAAEAHGCAADDYKIVVSPRRAGDWIDPKKRQIS